MARETGWGFTRIKFQLEQLGIKVARSTIIAILKEAGLPTGPERGEQTWDDFIRAHSKTLWACDFASKRVLTKRGWKDAFFLIFIHLKSRHVHISPATFKPTRAWTVEQVGGFTAPAREAGHRARILIRDNDSKFGPKFDAALRANKVEPCVLPLCSPNMNAYAERFILPAETLGHDSNSPRWNSPNVRTKGRLKCVSPLFLLTIRADGVFDPDAAATAHRGMRVKQSRRNPG